jgi:hypothetical protein
MKTQHVALGLTALAVLNLPLAANAHGGGGKIRSFDVCVDPTVDFKLVDNDGSGTPTAGDLFTAVGAIYPKDTIVPGAPPFDPCTGLDAADRIGTFYTNGHFVRPLFPDPDETHALPGSPADDLALVTWHFTIDGVGAVDTIGPVKAIADGDSYPQTVVGGTGRFEGSKGEATTTSLGGGGFQFQMKIPK